MLQFKRKPDGRNGAVSMTADVGDYQIYAHSYHGLGTWTLQLYARNCEQPIASATIEPDADHNTPEHVAEIALDRVLSALYGRATAYQKVAAAISAMADDGEVERTYAAVVRSSACRDTQVASTPDAEPLDDDAWSDVEDAEMFVGLFTGTRDAVLRMAADFAGVHVENIRLVPATEARKVG